MPLCGHAPSVSSPAACTAIWTSRACRTGYPQFFARAEGATCGTSTATRYVDFMCAYGPMVLGLRQSARSRRPPPAQRALGDTLTGPSERLVELAEKLVGMVAHADWAMFQRTAPTPRRLCVDDRAGRHHEAQDPGGARRLSGFPRRGARRIQHGTTAEDRVHLVHYDYNDVGSLLAAACARPTATSPASIASAFKPRPRSGPGDADAGVRPGACASCATRPARR